MIQSNKPETLARAAITIAVALAWCLCAYVAFVAGGSGDTVLGITDLDLSKPPVAVALYERIKNAAAISADGRRALQLSVANAVRLARLLRGRR